MLLKILKDTVFVVLKSLTSIAALFFLSRLIGRKSIAQLTFFDYILGITIGSVAASMSVENNINYHDGLTALFTWGLFAYLVAYLSVKSIWARRFFDSTPTILIQNGEILEKNMRKEKININDFLEELRIKNVFDVSDIEFAILETNGEVSVQLKSQKRPLTPEDMNIPTSYEGLTANLIIDGKIMKSNLKLVNLDEIWLTNELSKRKIYSVKEVVLASLNTKGQLYIVIRDRKSGKGILE
jgi:uncharacterized membrane protein YcaP (DUF421 family)